MRLPETHYIVVTGGVLSGLGKGVVTASLGALLKAQGYKVSAVKIDPYINIDAGTMRPTEHGEVFVTDDGGETDQDLGTYERFLNVTIPKSHSITTGQVYLSVIEKERNLEYQGKCVEVIPHIPREVQRRLYAIAESENLDFLLIEVGGTIGDYQSVLFLEAAREMKYRKKKVVFIHVAYLPIPNNIGEMKTKPTQHSVRELMSSGIQPDFIVARGQKPLDDVRREKISMFCNVEPSMVLSAPDCDSIYEVPILFQKQQFTEKVFQLFGLPYDRSSNGMDEWKAVLERMRAPSSEVRIGIIGKYFDIGDFTLADSYVSVIEAVKHAASHLGIRAKILWIDSKKYESVPPSELEDVHGVIIPGAFGATGVEGKINAIKFCRENNIPFLGLCYGLQLAVVEFARNKMGLMGAHTTEINPAASHPVIDLLPEQRQNMKEKRFGATMRLGAYPARLLPGSKVEEAYGSCLASERHRHRFEVNPDYVQRLMDAGLVISGSSPDERLVEFVELNDHPFFVGTQAHPEFKSRFLSPSPLFLRFLGEASKREAEMRKS